VLDFVPGVFRPLFGIWPFYFCGVVKGFFLVYWGLWRARADVAMEAVDSVVTPIKEFAKDSVRLVNRCHKPDRKARLCLCFESLGSIWMLPGSTQLNTGRSKHGNVYAL
jgi:hypothetical protein